MQRIIKNDNSEIITQNLKYIENNTINNKKISNVLFKEQKGFCAYTEEYIGRSDARDIEHFNPTLKGTELDNYINWFLVKHQVNKEKSSKWEKYQPILHPTDENFDSKILYENGDYRVANSNDVKAVNLVKLLKLDDIHLADDRKKYIRRKRDEIDKYGLPAIDFFEILLEKDIKQVCYLRAIQEEFKIDIWQMIPELKK